MDKNYYSHYSINSQKLSVLMKYTTGHTQCFYTWLYISAIITYCSHNADLLLHVQYVCHVRWSIPDVQTTGLWDIFSEFLWCQLCLCGLQPTCAGMHHWFLHFSACHSRKKSNERSSIPPPTPVTLFILSYPLTLLTLDRYEVTCHQSPLHLQLATPWWGSAQRKGELFQALGWG